MLLASFSYLAHFLPELLLHSPFFVVLKGSLGLTRLLKAIIQFAFSLAQYTRAKGKFLCKWEVLLLK